MYIFAVAPLVGAWIEMSLLESISIDVQSLPSWERGLKSACRWQWTGKQAVAPLVGAWIEISPALTSTDVEESLPSWERGLKLRVW